MTNSYEIKYNLIIESCKLEPDNTIIQNYMKNIRDWSSLLDISYVHGVLPLVYKTLKKQENFPSEALSMFKMQNMQIAQTNMQMSAELVRIVKILDENDIKYMAIKGPVLSQIIHGNTIERQYADLDILVDKKDLYKAGELLLENSYTSDKNIKFLKNKTLLSVAKDFLFTSNHNNIELELHWKLFLDRQVKESGIDMFSSDYIASSINAYDIKTLKLEHFLLYLCLHGSKHLWERIEWVVDIDRLIKENATINWDEIQQIAKTMKIENMFYLGLFVTHKILKTDLPSHLLEKIVTLEKVKESYVNIEKSYYTNRIMNSSSSALNKSGPLQSLRDSAQMKDNSLIALSYYVSTLFEIKDKDVYLINLPNKMSLCYYCIRLYRFINETIFALIKRK